MARHGVIYRVFFPRNSYDASLSIVGGWLWLFILLLTRSIIIWVEQSGTLVVVGGIIGIVAAVFHIGIWLRLRFRFAKAFQKFWTWCHILLPLLYLGLDIGVIIAVYASPPTMAASVRSGLFTTLKAFSTASAGMSWVHFTWVTATVRSKKPVLEAKKNPDEPDNVKIIVPPVEGPTEIIPTSAPQPQQPANGNSPPSGASGPAGWNRATRPDSAVAADV